MTKILFPIALTTIAVSFLAGCATELEPTEEGSSTTVVSIANEADDVKPAAPNTGGGDGCTTTKSCDRDYCCTTETCPFSTMITCVPAPKKTKNGTVAMAP